MNTTILTSPASYVNMKYYELYHSLIVNNHKAVYGTTFRQHICVVLTEALMLIHSRFLCERSTMNEKPLKSCGSLPF